MYDQSNLMGGRKPSYLTADFSIRTLSATCIGSVPVVWTKRRSYRRSCRRYNGGTTAVRTPTERRYNAGTTPVQRRPDRASSILKTLFCTYLCIVRRVSYRILQATNAAPSAKAVDVDDHTIINHPAAKSALSQLVPIISVFALPHPSSQGGRHICL